MLFHGFDWHRDHEISALYHDREMVLAEPFTGLPISKIYPCFSPVFNKSIVPLVLLGYEIMVSLARTPR